MSDDFPLPVMKPDAQCCSDDEVEQCALVVTMTWIDGKWVETERRSGKLWKHGSLDRSHGGRIKVLAG